MNWIERLEEIKRDNSHGATYLTRKLIEVALEADNIQRFLSLAWGTQPYMASIYNFLVDLHKALQEGEDRKSFCQRWWEEFEREHQKVVESAVALIADRSLLVHSFSSALLEAILRSRVSRVMVTESRPKREGVELAKRLWEEGISVELIIDGAAPFFVQEVELVLFGADGVGSFGLIHKVGSYPIALAAREKRVKVGALAHPKKFFPKGFRLPKQPLRDPNEICRCRVPRRNIYFDITPLKLISHLIR
ncbi:MAG: hypothetical protein GXO19_03785 [Epsilonproteobacteria bacterium]|nr:hypothetical protein [Campylobacterota bacterium]NPA56841.1 hypothetical protein [Campylobacterota bacterium]